MEAQCYLLSRMLLLLYCRFSLNLAVRSCFLNETWTVHRARQTVEVLCRETPEFTASDV